MNVDSLIIRACDNLLAIWWKYDRANLTCVCINTFCQLPCSWIPDMDQFIILTTPWNYPLPIWWDCNFCTDSCSLPGPPEWVCLLYDGMMDQQAGLWKSYPKHKLPHSLFQRWFSCHQVRMPLFIWKVCIGTVIWVLSCVVMLGATCARTAENKDFENKCCKPLKVTLTVSSD